jgi:predicted transposase YbfD/YdcC
VIGKCSSERTVNGQTSCEERYFIGSRDCSAEQYGIALRNHWKIENNLHWQMDVSFAEDASRIQKRYGGQNFALLRRLALGLLKRHPSKESIKSKRYEAALDVTFLEEVLR